MVMGVFRILALYDNKICDYFIVCGIGVQTEHVYTVMFVLDTV